MVDEEKDIEKVFQNSSKIVAVHSEDEEILKIKIKNYSKKEMFIHIQYGEVRKLQCLLLEELLKSQKDHNKKAHILHITTKQEIDFLSQHKGNITFEITPQHLTIYAPDCYDKLGTYAQMNPPIKRHRSL